MKSEDGYIVVETTLGFTLFLMLILSILTLINILYVQTRVHYALTQTVQEVSMYTYVLVPTGMADVKTGMNKGEVELNKFLENIDDVVSGISGLGDSDMGEVWASGESAFEQGKAYITNPKTLIRDMVGYFGNDLIDDGFANHIVKNLFKKYIAFDGKPIDDFFIRHNIIGGVEGIDFSESRFLPETDNAKSIEIVAKYKIKYTFGLLPLPFNELAFTQKAKSMAWLAGNGKTYE